MKRKQQAKKKGSGRSHLKKVRLEVEKWSEKHSKKDVDETVIPRVPQISRKQRRKEARKLKKAKKLEFYNRRRPKPEVEPEPKEIKPTSSPVKSKGKEKEQKKEVKSKPKEKKKTVKKSAKENEIEKLRKANEEEDRLINQLGKKLKLDKRKRNKLPAAFRDEGLDDLLEFCDSENRASLVDYSSQNIFDDDESGSDQELSDEDEALVSGEGRMKKDGSDDGDDEDDYDDDNDDDDVESEKERTVKGDVFDEDVHGSDEDDDDEEGEEEEEEDDDEDEMSEDAEEQSDFSGDSDSNDDALTKQKPDKRTSKDLSKKRKEFEDTDDEKSIRKKIKTAEEGRTEKRGGKSASSDELDESVDECEQDTQEDSPKKKKRKKDKKEKVQYDIYGRVIGGKEEKSTDTYVPPQQRAKLMAKDENKQKLERLRRQVKGLLNRLSESNMQAISTQIEELYLKNSRNDMCETLTRLTFDACASPIATPERLAMEHMMLLSLLHINVGNEVGAHFLQVLAKTFGEKFDENDNHGDGKECDNMVLLFSHLYNFKIIHCVLIYDIIRKFVQNFSEKDIEMLLLLLKNVGLSLRKDDPLSLKEVILGIQSKASESKDKFKDQTRVKFMLETIGALRNNNLRKIPNYDPSHLEHLKKILRALLKDHSISEGQLRISLSDLLTAEEKGRWWVVGSAWEGQQSAPPQAEGKETVAVCDKISGKIMDLSKKQRMNTDVRRNIFTIVVTSEDYIDAFNKLLHLNLKDRQEREIVYVVLDCCLQEKVYNPYYAYLASKFCQFDRRFQIAFQFALWDKFKVMDKLTAQQSTNLAKLLVHLLVSKSVTLSLLKVIDFAELDKSMLAWLRQLLSDLLLETPRETCQAVFAKIAPQPKLQPLRDGLRLFMHHFMLKQKRKLPEERRERLSGMVKVADDALQGNDVGMMM